jgi:adenosylhomocysteine nucleosidase
MILPVMDSIGASVRTMVGLGVIAATPALAKCFAPAGGVGPAVITTYGDSARAKAAARRLAAGGARALFSFGPAVGLAPLLRPGDLVIAECIVLPSGETIETDSRWRSDLGQRLRILWPNLTIARLAGHDRLAASADEKRAVFRATFAAAQDRESHAVAEVARETGLPFLALRAIADPAEQSRPYASPMACLVRPWEIAAVWRFARSGRAAVNSLRQVATLGSGPLAIGG